MREKYTDIIRSGLKNLDYYSKTVAIGSNEMRFEIIKNHAARSPTQSNVIGHINYDDMTDALLESIIALDYTVELKPTPKPKEAKQV